MESRALIDREGITGNTVSLTTESLVDSPLRSRPIRQVMVGSPLAAETAVVPNARH
jgi:hypothetical protein